MQTTNNRAIVSWAKRVWKEYSLTRTLLIAALVLGYVSWPLAPPDFVPPSALHIVEGKARFQDTLTSRMSDTYFFVGEVRLNCSLGEVDGRNGCSTFEDIVKKNYPARAAYFYMPTRVGLKYRVLYLLEQDGEVVISEEQMRRRMLRSYEGKTMFIRYFFLVALILLTVGFLIDLANIKYRNRNTHEGA